MLRKRKSVFRRILAGLAALLLLVVVAIGFLTATGPGLNLLAGVVSNAASGDEGGVEIKGISGVWSGTTRIASISLSDSEGIYARVTDAEADWSRGALFSWVFRASRVTASNVEVLRQPVSTGGDDSSSGLPIQIDLQDVRLQSLSVGEALIGKTMVFAAKAALSAHANPADISGSFQVNPLQREGALKGTFSYDADSGVLKLDAGLSEPSDGVLATAFDLPGKPPVGLSAVADGTLQSLTFKLRGEVGGNDVIDIAGSGGLSGETFFLKAQGRGTPSQIAPERFRQLLAGPFALELDASGETSGRLMVHSARIDGENFFAVVRGDLDLEGNSDLSGGLTAKNDAVQLTEELVAGLPELAVRSIAFSVKGPSGAAALVASADLPLLDAGEARLSGIRANLSAPSFDLKARSGDFTVEMEADGAQFANDDVQRLFPSRTYGAAKGAMAGERIEITHITLDNEALVANGGVAIALDGPSVEGTMDLRVGAKYLPSSLAGFSTQDARMSGRFAVAPGNKITVSDLRADFGGLTAAGSAELSGKEIAARLTADAKALQALDPQLNGALAIAAELTGPLAGPTVELTAKSNRIEANGHALTDLAASVSGLADMTKPDLKLALSGVLDGLPLTGEGKFVTASTGRVLEHLVLSNGENRIAGDIAIAHGGVPEGELAVQLPDISAFAALAGQDLTGGLTGKLTFSARDGLPYATARFSGERLSAGELEIEGLAADLSAREYLSAPALEGVARIASLRQGGTVIRPLEANFAFDDGWTRFDAKGTSDGIPVSVAGRTRSADGTVTVELAEASAVFRGVPLALASPSTVTVREGTASLQQVTISAGGGTTAISGTAGQALDLTAELRGIGASIANKLVPGLQADGSISGQVTVTGKPADPDVRFRMNWENAATAETRSAGLAGLNVAADGRFFAQTVTVSLGASGGGGIDLKGDGSAALGGAQQLDFRLNGTLPYSILAAQLARQGLSLQGNANVDLTLSGSPSSPVINGTVSSSAGRFVHAESGIAVSDLALAARFDGTRAVVERLNGNLSGGGTVAASGDVGLSGGFPADLSIRVRNGRYSDRRTVDATFNADLGVTGALVGDPQLSGDINLATGVITVPDRLPESISRLNVHHLNASEGVNRQSAELQDRNGGDTSSSSGLRLNLTLNAPNRVFVRGRGIDAELGGSMQLQGPVSSPGTLGGFEMRRGRLSILGKRLDFTRGKIHFAGSLVPELDMVAQSVSDGTTILVTVRGQADQPEFLFSSVPALAEDEVLARLIFNRNLSNLSPLQIAQLAQAAATLAGKGGNTSLLGKLQNALQVDDLDVRTDSETGETTVGVGRYVNDRTYVGVERGQSGGSGKVRIDLNVGRGVKLRGEATETGKNKAGIFYEREY